MDPEISHIYKIGPDRPKAVNDACDILQGKMRELRAVDSKESISAQVTLINAFQALVQPREKWLLWQDKVPHFTNRLFGETRVKQEAWLVTCDGCGKTYTVRILDGPPGSTFTLADTEAIDKTCDCRPEFTIICAV